MHISRPSNIVRQVHSLASHHFALFSGTGLREARQQLGRRHGRDSALSKAGGVARDNHVDTGFNGAGNLQLILEVTSHALRGAL